METPANPPTEKTVPTEFPDALTGVLDDLTKTENHINQLRAFIKKWKPQLLMCETWSAGPTYKPSITIRKGYGEFAEHWNPKKIARAFSVEGWKRHKNTYTCGQIDWRIAIDGIDLEIEGAEILDLKPREDVRL